MKRHAPEVAAYMTRLPVEAERCETVADAVALMQQHQIHHLPVMSGSRLKGVVSRSDLLRARAELHEDAGAAMLEEVCQSDVLIVRPVTAIDEVARQLLKRGNDSAVVMDGGFVVGILTTTDLLRFVADFFGQRET